MTECVADTFAFTIPAPRWGGYAVTVVVNIIGTHVQAMICGDRDGNAWAINSSGPVDSIRVEDWGNIVKVAGFEFMAREISLNGMQVLGDARIHEDWYDGLRALVKWAEPHVLFATAEGRPE